MYISITHAPVTKGIENMPLSNGQYIVPMVCICEKYYFSKPKNKYKFSRQDGPTLKIIYKLNKM